MRHRIILQIIFWILVAGITYGFTSVALPTGLALKSTAMQLFFSAVVFYTNALYLFPKYYSEHNNTKYIILVLVLLLIATSIPVEIQERVMQNAKQVPPKFIKHPRFFITVRMMFWFVFMIMISTVYLIQKRLREHILETKVIEEEKLETELKLLKAQINPHFLFNALNNIYSLSYMKSDTAPEGILKLSGMLRYVIEDCVHEFVPVKSEIEYIKNYISFQEMKSPYEMNVEFNCDDHILEKRIAPLLFIPFIENSFKYSKIEEFQKAFIKIELRSTKNGIDFEIFNSIPPTAKAKPGSGTGIKNVKQRLEIIYPGKHELTIEENKEEFKTRLTIDTT